MSATTRAPLLLPAAAALGALALSCTTVGGVPVFSTDAFTNPAGMNQLQAQGTQLIQKGEECYRLSTLEVPLAEEMSIGGAVAVKWVIKGGGLVLNSNDPKASSARGPKDQMTLYLNRVGRNLAMQSSRPTIDWTFGVLESDDFNAISTPGGYVLVTRGLLNAVENEAQLAGVLGHEIAHVTEKHAVAAYRKVKADSCRAAFTGMVFGAATEHFRTAFTQMLGDTGKALNLDDELNFDVLHAFTDSLTKALEDQGFESQQEYDADRLGLALVIGAGYNPHEYVKFLARIPQTGNAFPHHPSNADRQHALVQFINTYQEQPELYPDYPFDRSPVVTLRGELAPARR